MATWLTDADVEALIEVDASISLTPFIAMGEAIVTKFCMDSGYSTAILTLLAANLAAHFYAMRDKQVASEKAGAVGVSYQYEIGKYLEQTVYGQAAIALDTDGSLAAYQKRLAEGKKAGATVTWLGKDLEDAVLEDYT